MGAPKAFFKVRSTWNFDLVAIFEMNPHGTGDFVSDEILACKSLWGAQGTMGGFSARVQYFQVLGTFRYTCTDKFSTTAVVRSKNVAICTRY